MNNRLEWIDALKGFAIITVVLGHCVGGVLAANYFKNDYLIVKGIFDFIYSFHMPLFFSASGFLFYLTKTYDKYKIKIADLFLMYVFWTVITWIIKYAAGGSINHPVSVQTLITNIYNPTFIYWYIYSLMLMYLFYSVVKIKQITVNTLLILSIAACIVKILPVNIGIVGKTIYFMYFFAFGGYLCNNHKYQNISKKFFLFCCGMVVLNLFLYCNNINFITSIEIIKGFILANAAIIITYYIFLNNHKFNILKIFGLFSLHIYLMHDFIVAGTRMTFIKLGNENLIAYLAIGTILGTIIPVLIARFCENKGILNYPFAPVKTLKALTKAH